MHFWNMKSLYTSIQMLWSRIKLLQPDKQNKNYTSPKSPNSGTCKHKPLCSKNKHFINDCKKWGWGGLGVGMGCLVLKYEKYFLCNIWFSELQLWIFDPRMNWGLLQVIESFCMKLYCNNVKDSYRYSMEANVWQTEWSKDWQIDTTYYPKMEKMKTQVTLQTRTYE